MTMFVHLAPETRSSLIRRNGVRRLRKAFHTSARGVFAVPVVRNFFISHQWCRELRRRSKGQIVGIYFRIPDTEGVWVGHYGQVHRQMTAARASAEFMQAVDRQGWEVIIPRPIDSSEIHRIRSLPQVVGWRFLPGAKGRIPCTCRFCTRGDYGARKLRERLGASDE